ncbi:hypothetical protein Q7P35_008339 [Cladosporium inversicolor]
MALPSPRLYNPSTDHPLLDPIARLHAACILRDNLLATFLPPLSHDKILDSWKAWSEQVVAGNRVIVLQLSEAGELAGVVSLGFPDTETGKHRSEVGRLLVSHEFRKRGIARRMMEVLEGAARERRRWMMLLDTTIGSGAEFVYPKLGYKEIGIVPAYGFSPKDGSMLDEIFFYKDVRQS